MEFITSPPAPRVEGWDPLELGKPPNRGNCLGNNSLTLRKCYSHKNTKSVASEDEYIGDPPNADNGLQLEVDVSQKR